MVKLVRIEALRGIAALYVVLHHFDIGDDSWIKYFTQQGQLAVILFFLVSGFVLHVSNHQAIESGKLNFKKYFIKRFRRIYPVLILSMVLSYIALCLSQMHIATFDWLGFFANLCNIQDLDRHPGFWVGAFAKNSPLWSLTYEWWFYMMFFPIARYVNRNKQRYLALAVSIFGILSFWLYPNQISIVFEYFIVWWVGVELGSAWQQKKILSKDTLSFCYWSLILIFALQVIRLIVYKETQYPHFDPYKYPDYSGKWDPAYYPAVNVVHTGYALFLLTTGLLWYRFKLAGFDKTIGYFAFFAPISYSIYVFHFPLVMKYKFPFFSSPLVQYVCCMLVLFPVCYLVEVRLQRSVNKVLR